jgi:hypothetical protein
LRPERAPAILAAAASSDGPALLVLLARTGYGGWVMLEEESEAARADPAAAVARNRA